MAGTGPQLLAVSRTLGRQADRLEDHARRLREQASALEAEAFGTGPTVVSGRAIVDRLLMLVAPGHVHHYKDLVALLGDAGLRPSGRDPAATLLTALSRAPEFERTDARGCWLRGR